MKRYRWRLFLALAVLGLVLPANALAFRTGAYVQMSNGSSCSSCQFLVEEGNGQPWIVAVGSLQTFGPGTFYDAAQGYWQLNSYASYNAWTDHFTDMSDTILYHMWARRPCGGGGYSYSPSRAYHAPLPPPAYSLVFGETLTIDASHCQPA